MHLWQTLKQGASARTLLVEELVATRTPPIVCMRRLGAFHGGLQDERPLREDWKTDDDQYLHPAPDALGLLVAALFGRLEQLWPTCEAPRDDILVAVLAIYGLLKIRPFGSGNGRTAVDLAQVLLMYRWGLTTLRWAFADNAHAEFELVLAPMDAPAADDPGRVLIDLAVQLGDTFRDADLPKLRTIPQFNVLADWLEPGMVPSPTAPGS